VPGLTPSLASQLPQGAGSNMDFVHDINHCGSWLASDGVSRVMYIGVIDCNLPAAQSCCSIFTGADTMPFVTPLCV
jgi:hypothetical protein